MAVPVIADLRLTVATSRATRIERCVRRYLERGQRAARPRLARLLPRQRYAARAAAAAAGRGDADGSVSRARTTARRHAHRARSTVTAGGAAARDCSNASSKRRETQVAAVPHLVGWSRRSAPAANVLERGYALVEARARRRHRWCDADRRRGRRAAAGALRIRLRRRRGRCRRYRFGWRRHARRAGEPPRLCAGQARPVASPTSPACYDRDTHRLMLDLDHRTPRPPALSSPTASAC